MTERTIHEIEDESERRRQSLGQILDQLEETKRERDELSAIVYQVGRLSKEERADFRWALMELIQSLDDYQPEYGAWHRGVTIQLKDRRYVHVVLEVDSNNSITGAPHPTRYIPTKKH